MKIKIKYKTDESDLPYCAYVQTPSYNCQWSGKSFEDAKQRLLVKLKKTQNLEPCPPDEEVEI